MPAGRAWGKDGLPAFPETGLGAKRWRRPTAPYIGSVSYTHLQVVVRSAGYDAQAAFFQFGGKGLRVGDDLPDVFLVSGLHGFLEADGLGSDDVHQGAALNAGEYLPVDFGGIGFLAENHAAARAAQGFMRGGGDKVGVGRGVGMKARGDEARKVGHIHHEPVSYTHLDVYKRQHKR